MYSSPQGQFQGGWRIGSQLQDRHLHRRLGQAVSDFTCLLTIYHAWVQHVHRKQKLGEGGRMIKHNPHQRRVRVS